MPERTADDIRRLDDDDLNREINEAYRALFTLRFQHASRQLENYRELRNARRRIARLADGEARARLRHRGRGITMGQQRVIQGTVVSDKMDKTIVVAVERRKKHRLYHKVVTFTRRYKAHDEGNACRLGDVVRIVESPPISKDKRWRVIDVLSKGDVAEVAPETIGREIERPPR